MTPATESRMVAITAGTSSSWPRLRKVVMIFWVIVWNGPVRPPSMIKEKAGMM
ncbi:hypothetical protein D3C72_2374930 [compost metagenome]